MEHLIETSPGSFRNETLFPVHGIFLPTVGAFVNHSCDPNLSISNNYNHEMRWEAEKEIGQDEEMFVSYIDPMLPLDERREILFNRFNFWCHCALCKKQEEEQEAAEEE